MQSSPSARSRMEYYLVDHPRISRFEWSPETSLLSSQASLAAAIGLYLTLVVLLLRRGRRPPSASPSPLRLLAALHNLLLLLLSLLMGLGGALAALRLPASALLCLPDPTPPSGPLFFWGHAFYLSKLYELLDTVLILLSDPRRLSFLHVYHHALVPAVCRLWLSTRQSLFPVALVTNAFVHVLMYAYYLSCTLGFRWPRRWKRAVTDLQIAQFVFSFAISAAFLWLHWTSAGGCSGFRGWLFNAAFNASLLWLFLDFHRRSYGAGRKKTTEDKES